MLILVLVLPLSIVLCIQPRSAAQSAQRERLKQQVHEMQNEAAVLIKEERFAQASDKLEELQVLCMKTGRYQEALKASFKIEEVSPKVSDRKSPWNYVRIAEAYLGLGDQERYIGWMEKAVYERSFSKLDYFQDARLDALQDHPRFKKLVDACAKEIGVGQRAKDFQITLLDGSPFTLSAHLGKVVLVDLKETALPWEIACSWDGWDDSTAKRYKVSATPSTRLIDRHGIVRYYDVRGQELRRAVEALIRES